MFKAGVVVCLAVVLAAGAPAAAQTVRTVNGTLQLEISGAVLTLGTNLNGGTASQCGTSLLPDPSNGSLALIQPQVRFFFFFVGGFFLLQSSTFGGL